MAANENDQLVVAYFDTKLSAELAVEALKGWDYASEDIKLGALAVVSKNEEGKIETSKLGARNTGTGAEIGVIVGVVVALLSGGLTIVGGTILGMAVGAGVGALSKQGIGLTQEDLDRMKSELDAGHAAVLAMVDEAEIAGTTAELARIGGRTQVHLVDLEAVAQADKALGALPSDPVSTTTTEGSE